MPGVIYGRRAHCSLFCCSTAFLLMRLEKFGQDNVLVTRHK